MASLKRLKLTYCFQLFTSLAIAVVLGLFVTPLDAQAGIRCDYIFASTWQQLHDSMEKSGAKGYALPPTVTGAMTHTMGPEVLRHHGLTEIVKRPKQILNYQLSHIDFKKLPVERIKDGDKTFLLINIGSKMFEKDSNAIERLWLDTVLEQHQRGQETPIDIRVAGLHEAIRYVSILGSLASKVARTVYAKKKAFVDPGTDARLKFSDLFNSNRDVWVILRENKPLDKMTAQEFFENIEYAIQLFYSDATSYFNYDMTEPLMGANSYLGLPMMMRKRVREMDRFVDLYPQIFNGQQIAELSRWVNGYELHGDVTRSPSREVRDLLMRRALEAARNNGVKTIVATADLGPNDQGGSLPFVRRYGFNPVGEPFITHQDGTREYLIVNKTDTVEFNTLINTTLNNIRKALIIPTTVSIDLKQNPIVEASGSLYLNP